LQFASCKAFADGIPSRLRLHMLPDAVEISFERACVHPAGRVLHPVLAVWQGAYLSIGNGGRLSRHSKVWFNRLANTKRGAAMAIFIFTSVPVPPVPLDQDLHFPWQLCQKTQAN
jgi:hypothetical protein